jgi:hypothetical protein
MATDTTPITANDPGLVVLQRQLTQLEARVKIQQDQQALVSGLLPTSTTPPNQGTVTVSGSSPFDSQKLAYSGLVKVGKEIAKKIPASGSVVIYDQTEINNLVNFRAVSEVLNVLNQQADWLDNEFRRKLHPEASRLLAAEPKDAETPGPKAFVIAPIVTPALVLGGLKAASDLIGMFRTNTTIAYSSFTADDAALIAVIAGELAAANRQVYEPAVMPLRRSKSDFLKFLSNVETTQTKLHQDVSIDQGIVQMAIDALGAYLQAEQALQANQDATKQASLTAARDQADRYALAALGGSAPSNLNPQPAAQIKSHWEQFQKVMNGFLTSVSAAETLVGTFQTALMAVTNTGSAALTSVLRGECLKTIVETKDAIILQVKTSVLGGSVVTRQNLFSGGHLLFTGGAIANYTLFDADGVVKSSGVVVGETGSKSARF